MASYAYDALGRRITETDGSGSTDHLYYSPQWQVIEERQGGTAASDVSYQYVWGAGGVDQLVLRDTYTGGTIVPASRLYAQWDANGDVTALVNTSGTVVERYLYDPYGSVTVTDANWNPLAGNASADAWRYLFQGGRLDTATGWYNFRNRDLIPSEGRWAERDPLGLAAGDANVYEYEGSHPVDAADPSGEFWHVVIGAGIGAAVGYYYGGWRGAAAGAVGGAVFAATLGAAAPSVAGAIAAGGSRIGANFAAGALAGAMGDLAQQQAGQMLGIHGPVDANEVAVAAATGGALNAAAGELSAAVTNPKPKSPPKPAEATKPAETPKPSQPSECPPTTEPPTPGTTAPPPRVVYPNQMPLLLQGELADAASVGARPIRFGDPGFNEAVNSGTVKFVVTLDGEVVITPHTIRGMEIPHSVLSDGQPVLAAGEAEIAVVDGNYVGINISNHSGHFMPAPESLQVAREAFANHGINFPSQ